ncbi:large ribosomal subunit protein bL35m-like [Watersipora subatra]|uniref:large ribosomal subunit protein bL35m-like n=1 Tax=Watersipora subatra TaxID=2589382 RepID=UPI00355C592A
MSCISRIAFAACKLLQAPSCFISKEHVRALSSVAAPKTSLDLSIRKDNGALPHSSGLISRLLGNSGIVMQQSRTRVYQSWKKGKPETVREVPSRFMRLGNGLWIRPRAGRRKGLWKRKPETLEDLKQHVICSKRQCWMLERMVGKYWKRDHHYPNDPYAPYHVRNGFNNDIVYKPNRPPFYP